MAAVAWAAVGAQIRSLVWALPCAVGVTKKKKSKEERKKKDLWIGKMLKQRHRIIK